MVSTLLLVSWLVVGVPGFIAVLVHRGYYRRLHGYKDGEWLPMDVSDQYMGAGVAALTFPLCVPVGLACAAAYLVVKSPSYLGQWLAKRKMLRDNADLVALCRSVEEAKEAERERPQGTPYSSLPVKACRKCGYPEGGE